MFTTYLLDYFNKLHMALNYNIMPCSLEEIVSNWTLKYSSAYLSPIVNHQGKPTCVATCLPSFCSCQHLTSPLIYLLHRRVPTPVIRTTSLGHHDLHLLTTCAFPDLLSDIHEMLFCSMQYLSSKLHTIL